MVDCDDRSIVNNEIQAFENDRNTDVCIYSTSYSIQLYVAIHSLSTISDDGGDTDVIPDTNTQLAIT